MLKIIILSGAGMSAESGIQTFRDGDGLWNKYRFEDLASPSAWHRDPKLVLDFYNMRRKIVFEAEPNAGHKALAKLEEKYAVQIITQNVDDLHERAGSSNVLHLHGEIKKARSTLDPELVYDMDNWELNIGDKCEKGSQLRPHIVWFGEAVTMIEPAMRLASGADIFIVIGTSMVVYPAASLIVYVPASSQKYFIDPKAFQVGGINKLEVIKETAGKGVPELVDKLLVL
ncbi:MAG: NAD-dependent deacylase [Bacteroidales bacterium]|nr:NAD-dependent deacylase [Bacteroidales bacterium]MCF8404156.1 NAD-dependent deacylase [Bacteroidales bacterium]